MEGIKGVSRCSLWKYRKVLF